MYLPVNSMHHFRSIIPSKKTLEAHNFGAVLNSCTIQRRIQINIHAFMYDLNCLSLKLGKSIGKKYISSNWKKIMNGLLQE